jgi:hypothetical protein
MSPIHHFIHFYFFTEFEILFYIYYILPYEKELVYNIFSIKNLISDYDDDHVIKLLNNISNINNNNNNNKNKQCDSAQARIDNDNNTLWTYCFIYIISMNVLLVLFLVSDLIINYKYFYENRSQKIIKKHRDTKDRDNKDRDTKDRDTKDKIYNSQSSLTAFSSGGNLDQNYKKTDNISTFEIDMIDLEINTDDSGSPLNSNTTTPKTNEKIKEISYNSFYLYYWNKSVLVTAVCNTSKFIILIGIFEYVFFIFIVNKFKIINTDLLLCKIMKNIS